MGSSLIFSSRVFLSRDVARGILFMFFVPMAIGMFFFAAVPGAYAAITVAGPPIDPLFQDATVVGGAYVPLVQFRLQQSSGSDTLNSIAVAVTSTTTINNLNAGSTNGEINNLFLYRESGGHFGFQPSEDVLLNTAANAVTDPATTSPITITVDQAQRAVGTTATDYYVVARATTSAVLITGHAVYATTTANWITTSGGALGSTFTAMRKATFQRNVSNIKISEVKQGSTGNAGDEFIELYNTGDVPIDLSRLPLNLFIYNANGGIATKTITYINRVIPQKGYFLITSDTNYSGSTPADATYTTGSNDLIANGGFSISTTTTATGASVATTSAIDLIAWGSQSLANAASSTVPGLAAPTALANLTADKSYERKATTTSNAVSMAPGGFDATNGNGLDTKFNNTDFVLQTGANPQNSFSPQEFSFSGAFGQDTQKLSVAGSFPGPNQMGVPPDLTFVGFGFSKVVATGTIISAVATTTVTLTTGGGPNLCTSVSYNAFPSNFEPSAKCNLSAALLPNTTTYTFTVNTTVLDQSGNALDQDQFTAGNQSYSITFTTGGAGQTQTNTTPPMVLGTTPFPGGVNMPTNLAKILVKFNQSTMDQTTTNASNITLTSAGGAVSLSGFSFDATSSLLSFVPGTLAANTKYTLAVGTGVRSSNNIPLGFPYTTAFTTGAGTDITAPAVVGVIPASGNTLPLNAVDFVFSTDDYLDPSTATSTSVTLSFGGSNLPGTVSYDPVAQEGHFVATNPLPAGASNNLVLTLVAGAFKNISGTQIAANTFSYSTEGSNSDSAPPSVIFANADAFGIAVTFNEAVKATDATNLANYQVSVGGATTTLSSLAGQKISYDATKRTAQISGLFLQPASSFRVIVSGVKDISGNAMTSSSVTGTVLSAQQSGGSLGPGTTSNYGPQINDFKSSGIGFAPGLGVMPMNQFISATTTYGFMIPISKQIPAGGTIVITFPSSSDFGVCCATQTSTNNPQITAQNTDINGPGPGTIGMTVANDLIAKTITITTTGAATRLDSANNNDTHDMLTFALVNIKNPSVPKGVNSSGYSLDIKTKNASGDLLESFTSSPIYISGGSIGGSATTTVQGVVSAYSGTGLLQGVTVRLMAPQIGVLETTTDANGLYQFPSLPVNNQVSSFGTSGTGYAVFTDPIVSGATGTTTVFFGEPMPTPVNATSTSVITRNFALIATSSAINFTVKLTGDNSGGLIFKANEQVDVFANGPGRFIVQTFTTGTTNYSGTTVVTLPIPQVNGSWGIGMGPAMPKAMGNTNFGAPPTPTWVQPQPIQIVISGCPTACTSSVNGLTSTSNTFTVSVANRTIAGILKDGSGNLMSGADVFVFSPSQGFGNHAQTSSAGVFSIKVGDGSYNVGAFIPGIESARQIPVIVNSTGVFVDSSATASTGSSGANPFIFTMKKPSYTITGRVTDGTNAVANASVFAYRSDGPGNGNAITDSSGNYTLYADSGTWKVNAFIPGFGPMAQQSVTISDASQSSINFAPLTSLTYYTFSGIVFESADNVISTSTEGVSGVIVRISGTNGTNEVIAGSDGTFSMRVPSGTYTIVDVIKPGYGRIAPLDHNLTAIGSLDLSANLYKPIRLGTRQTVTVNIKDNTGVAIMVKHGFIDLFDTTTNYQNHVEINNGTTTTIQVPNGANVTVRAFIDGMPPQSLSVATDNGGSTVVSSGVLTVDGTEIIKVVLNTTAAGFVTVSGKVYSGSISSGNELPDAWVQFADATNNIRLGAQASSSGIFQLSLATSTYQVIAFKPGYLGVATTATITVNTSTFNVIMNAGGSTITGTVTANGTAAANTFVWAEKNGGGFTSAKTNAAGAYTLTVDSGQWRVYAATDGAQKTAYSGNPVSAGAVNITIPLTLVTSLITQLSTSNSFDDTAAASFSDTTVGIKVGVDGGALGSAGTKATLSAKKTANVPVASDTKILGNAGWDISAVNGTTAVTTLSSGKTADITLSESKADLTSSGVTTPTQTNAVTVVSWSDDKKAWESLSTVATFKDSAGAAVTPTSNLSNVASVDFTTSSASHFSPYALSSPTSGLAPATTTGLAVTQPSGTISAALSWTANTESDLSGYYIYQDTSSSGLFPLRATLGVVSSYTDTGLTAGTTYYYRISAFNTAGHESAAAAAVSIAIANATGASTPASGGGSPSIGQVTPTPVSSSAVVPLITVPPATPAGSVPAIFRPVPSGFARIFTKNLSMGSSGDDVKQLQALLKSDTVLYPEGLINGNFGPATLRAVKRFQKKYGIAQLGNLGPATRAKLQEVFGVRDLTSEKGESQAPPLTDARVPISAGGIAAGFVKDLTLGNRNDDVRRLQQLLSTDKDIYPEGVVNGNFGGATQRAIRRFQEKYGITKNGRVGPMTRAKLQEVFGVMQTH